jgi:hypothetical protein
MALEVITTPSRVVLAFDSLNDLSGSAHAEAYVAAFNTTLNCIKYFVSNDAQLVIPDRILFSCVDKGIDIRGELTLSKAIYIVEKLAKAFYFADDYEVVLEIKAHNAEYRLKCNSDPIVFLFELITSIRREAKNK